MRLRDLIKRVEDLSAGGGGGGGGALFPWPVEPRSLAVNPGTIANQTGWNDALTRFENLPDNSDFGWFELRYQEYNFPLEDDKWYFATIIYGSDDDASGVAITMSPHPYAGEGSVTIDRRNGAITNTDGYSGMVGIWLPPGMEVWVNTFGTTAWFQQPTLYEGVSVKPST